MDYPKYQFSEEDIQNNKGISAVSYLGILFFLPLVACPQSAFGRFHANQGLLLFLTGMIGSIALDFVPIFGGFLRSIFGLFIFVYMIVSIINTANGKANELPGIGHLRIFK